MNDPSSPSMGWTKHTLKYYAEINPTRIFFGPGYYAHCDLKRYGKLSNAASLLRDKKNRTCSFANFIRCKDFKRRGNYTEFIVHAMIGHDIHMEFI